MPMWSTIVNNSIAFIPPLSLKQHVVRSPNRFMNLCAPAILTVHIQLS